MRNLELLLSRGTCNDVCMYSNVIFVIVFKTKHKLYPASDYPSPPLPPNENSVREPVLNYMFYISCRTYSYDLWLWLSAKLCWICKQQHILIAYFFMKFCNNNN